MVIEVPTTQLVVATLKLLLRELLGLVTPRLTTEVPAVDCLWLLLEGTPTAVNLMLLILVFFVEGLGGMATTWSISW